VNRISYLVFLATTWQLLTWVALTQTVSVSFVLTNKFILNHVFIADLTIPAPNFEYAFNNVFMPPKLPQSGDSSVRENDLALLTFVSACAKHYGKFATDKVQWQVIEKMMKSMIRMRKSGSGSKFPGFKDKMVEGGASFCINIPFFIILTRKNAN
jgi:hypothetical protein